MFKTTRHLIENYGTVSYNEPSGQLLNNNGLKDWYNSCTQEDTILKSKIHIKETKMEDIKRGLYQVILVNPKTSLVIMNKMLVSDSLTNALIECGINEVLISEKVKVSDIDKIVNFLGTVRKYKKNKDGEDIIE